MTTSSNSPKHRLCFSRLSVLKRLKRKRATQHLTMYFHYTISTCALFCLLFIAVVGCDQVGDVAAPNTSKPAAQTAEPVSHYEQLLRKRLDLETKIREAMNLYRTTSQKVRTQRAQLRQSVGNMPVPEAIELFSKGNHADIPSNLRAAHSLWRTALMPDETLLKQIDVWIKTQLDSGVLVEMDLQIRNVENRQQLGRFLDQSELEEIDRLLAQSVVGWETIDAANLALIEQEVIQELKSADWE